MLNSLRGDSRVQGPGLVLEQVPVGDPVAPDRPRVYQLQLVLDPGDRRYADELEEVHLPGRHAGQRLHRSAGFDVGDVARITIDVHDASDHLIGIGAGIALIPIASWVGLSAHFQWENR